MKRYSRIILIAFGIILASTVSHSSMAQVSIGVRSGISVNSFWITPDAVSIREKAGLAVAIPLEIRLNEWLAVQPELAYIQKGVNYSRGEALQGSRNLLQAQTGKVSLDYVQVPLLVKFAPLSRRYFSFEAFTGPSLGALVRGEAFETFGEISENPPITRSLTGDLAGGDIKGLDIGWVIGSGIAYRLHGRNLARRYRTDLLLDVRYAIGTTQLDPVWTEGNVRNRSLSITLGMKVELGK